MANEKLKENGMVAESQHPCLCTMVSAVSIRFSYQSE